MGSGSPDKRVLLMVVIAGLAANLSQPPAASAASVKKCKAPAGARAPIRDLRAGYATSCVTGKKVAKRWDQRCEPYLTLCAVRAGGRRWSCRSQVYTVPKYRRTAFVKCAGKETVKGRPAVNFKQPGAVNPCAAPSGTQAAMQRLYGFYDARCPRAAAVARAWDRACEPGANRTTCAFQAQGERWKCTQYGRQGVDITYRYVCTSESTGRGRPAVQFEVRSPVPPGHGR